ncbi:MAG: chromosome segregation protein SMC [Caulobacterales bacterium]|jgi:chromosome segregation protein
MHIRELRIAGFKSFVDPMRAPIEAGLTGIVGPNGCGKSNVLEAVRWAMGSTSAKALRAGDMDDMIFAGSAARAPREQAEVTLVLENAAGRGPPEFAKDDVLEITRRIRREMGSTYLINGREVRAKDVQLLFADAATGANSPALVRQGQISELINAKPENRRRILEEAAGVSGLHARRHEADLKLRAAEANLVRVEESLKDMDAQAGQLRRQARQAERYRALAEELRQTELWLLIRRWAEADSAAAAAHTVERAAARDEAHAAEAASLTHRAALEADEKVKAPEQQALIDAAVERQLDVRRVGLARDLADAQAAVERAADAAARAGHEHARAEADCEAAAAALARLHVEASEIGSDDDTALVAARAGAFAAEAARAQAQAAWDAAARAASEAEAEARAAAAARQAGESRIVRAERRLADLTQALAAVTAPQGLAQARANAAAAEEAAQAAAATAASAEAKAQTADAAERAAKATLDAAQAKLAEIAAEVKALAAIAAPAAGKTFAPALDDIQVAPGYERALAAALGDDLEASLDPRAPSAWLGADIPDHAWPAGVERLCDQVHAPPALAARLALVGVADAALAESLVLGPGQRVVTKQGLLRRWDGFRRTAAAPAPAAVRLEQRNRLKAARASLEKAEAAARVERTAWDKAFAAREHAAAALRADRAAMAGAQRAAQDAARAGAQAEQESARIEARRLTLDAERALAEAELKEAKAALKPLALAKAAPDPAALAAARAQAEAARSRASDAQAAYVRLDQDRTARVRRRAQIDSERTDWRLRAADAAARLKAADAAAAAAAKDRAQADAAPHNAQAALAKLAEEAALADKRRRDTADMLAKAQARRRETAEAARHAEVVYHRAHDARATAAARLVQAAAALEIALAALEGMGVGDAAELIARAGMVAQGPLKDAAPIDVEKRLERLRGELDALGAVNLTAADELTAALARHETITREKEDVAAAIAKLRQAIGRLNAEARAKLMAAFETVNAQFAALFGALFDGGEAGLKLIENDDPLAAGLEIAAAPPGKRLSTLSLMSGGEQALTATALIFAVFLANPAPLCVLDEVDAPLDDANVERFCRLLDEMRKRTDTRFIVITHNPVTMARMDRLFGVTMAEAGVSQIVSVDLQKATALAAA